MDNYRTNRQGCGMRQGNNCQTSNQSQMAKTAPSSCGCNKDSIFQAVDNFPAAMAYVPCTHFGKTFELCKALQCGTIFPELCKPFCGKGGGGCK